MADKPSLVQELALSDIIRNITPHPEDLDRPMSVDPPNDVAHFQQAATMAAALDGGEDDEMDALGFQEVELLRSRIGDIQDTQLEKLVLRLLSTLIPSSEQLQAQAATISQLTRQRDFLLKRQEEEQLRWDSEKDEWSRISEVLLARSMAEGTRAKEFQMEQRCNQVSSENVVLKQKLQDNNIRLQSLESEIAQLKPLLLMQPFTLMHSHPALAPSTHHRKSTKEKHGSSTTTGGEQRQQESSDARKETLVESEDEQPNFIPISSTFKPGGQPVAGTSTSGASGSASSLANPPSTPSRPKGEYYRHRSPVPIASPSRGTKAIPPTTPGSSAPKWMPGSPSKGYSAGSVPRLSQTKPGRSRTLSADARAEHLLLAARRLGRERASILSGMFIPPAPSTAQYFYPYPTMPSIVTPAAVATATAAATGSAQQTPTAQGTKGAGAANLQPPALPFAGVNAQTQMFSPIFAPGSSLPAPPSTPPPRSRLQPSHGAPPSAPASSLKAYHTSNAKGKDKERVSERGRKGKGKEREEVLDEMGRPADKGKGKASERSLAASSNKAPTPNVLATPSAMESLLNAAQEVLSSPTTPTARRGTKRRRLSPTRQPFTPSAKDKSISNLMSAERPIGEVIRTSSALDVLADQALGGSQEEDSNDTSGNEGADDGMIVDREESLPSERPHSTTPAQAPAGEPDPVDEMTMDVDEPVQEPKATSREESVQSSSNRQPSPAGISQAAKSPPPPSPRPAVTPIAEAAVDPDTEDPPTAAPTGITTGASGTLYNEEDDEDADAEGEADPDGAFEADILGSGSVFTPADARSSHSREADKMATPTPPQEPAVERESRNTQPSATASTTTRSAAAAADKSSSGVALAPPINLTSSNGSATRALRPAATLPNIPTPKTPVSGVARDHTLATMQNIAPSPSTPSGSGSGSSGSLSGVVGVGPGKGFIHHEPSTGKRTRSPYMKWTEQEDVLLEMAVTKHGQKWDLVQKELPNRGYHQVRQRWLRKQGAFDHRVEVTPLNSGTPTSPVSEGLVITRPATPASPIPSAASSHNSIDPGAVLRTASLAQAAQTLAEGSNALPQKKQ